MVRTALTESLPEERRPRLMPVDTSLGPDAAAAAYEALLLETIGQHPRLDLALMGLGPDGHTASLFPGKPAVAETQRFCVGVPEAGMEPMVPRVTLTLPLFNTAREVVFLVAGADKATAVRARVRHAARRDGAGGARAAGRGQADGRARRARRRGARAVSEGRFIGLDVGGTKIAAAVLESGAFETFEPVPTRTDSSEQLVEQIVEEIERCRGETARAVAIGLPSIIDTATGSVRHSVNLPLRNVPLRAVLSERCGLPVYVENDASCAALAEAQVAGQIVCENLVMFTIGTGVGGGLVLERQALPRRDERRRAGPHADRARPVRRRAGRCRHVPAARLARGARVGPRARPAGARVGPRAPAVVPRRAAREGRRDHRARRGRGRARRATCTACT